MTNADMLDRLPHDPTWGHGRMAGSGGVVLHYVRPGRGDPVLVLHGRPGLWYDWRRVVVPLADVADVIAPDSVGSATPTSPTCRRPRGTRPACWPMTSSPCWMAWRFPGWWPATTSKRRSPRRSPCAIPTASGPWPCSTRPYPGIGKRRLEPSAQREFWYQHFHNLPWSDRLIAHDRETVRLYRAHFYDHWRGRKQAVRGREFEAIVDA